jgi:hypothetical protein
MESYKVLIGASVVVDEVDKEVFGVEQGHDCLRDLYPRPMHARVGVVGAAYLADLVVLEDV